MPSLMLHPDFSASEYVSVTPERAGWEHLHFAARRLRAEECWEHSTGDSELALVILGGVCSVRSSRGQWAEVGRRPNVFSGMPYTLYLPPRSLLVSMKARGSPALDV